MSAPDREDTCEVVVRDQLIAVKRKQLELESKFRADGNALPAGLIQRRSRLAIPDLIGVYRN